MDDYRSAVAPGADGVGDGMMRRHRSCLASALGALVLSRDIL